MVIKSQSQINDNENGLYLVSTPIGNLKDITLRAIETLKRSSQILCEDTRVSRNLLDRYEIKSQLISNHKFNESKNLNKIINLLKSREIISLISDAGTPCISDPGSILLNEITKKKIAIFFGSEVKGCSKETLKLADKKIRIPMYGFTESYNISVSVSLCLQHLVYKMRQSNVKWKLTINQQEKVMLQWLRNSIKASEKIEEQYLMRNNYYL